jgi:ParB-like chromosome segregation protein Spo0J
VARQLREAVPELSEEEAANIAFIDNEQRNNLSPIEVAKHYAFMRDTYKKSAQEIADEYGKSRQIIDQYWQIAKLGETICHTCGNLDKRILYTLSRLIDKPALIKVFEEGFDVLFDKWSQEQTKAYTTELDGREKDQIDLAGKIVAQELTVKQTEREVAMLLSMYRSRDEIIKMEESEKAKKAFYNLSNGFQTFRANFGNYARDRDSFVKLATMFSTDYFLKIPLSDRQRLFSSLEEFQEELLSENRDELLRMCVRLRENLEVAKNVD